MNRLKQHWPAVRAVFLTLVILHAIVYGIQTPVLSVQRLEHEYWQPLIGRVQGLTGDNEAESRARISRYSQQLANAKSYVTWPLAWLYGLLRAGQTWNMFDGAEQQSFQLYIDMRREGTDTWEVLYTAHDPTAAFEAERLEYRRVQACYIAFDAAAPGPYYPFTRWVAKRVFYTFEDADEVRVRMRRLDYRDRAVREARPERTLWAHGVRITRAQFERDMAALHD